MSRTLEKDGVNFAFKVLPEVKAKMWVESYHHADRHKAEGPELRSQAYAMGAMLCYFLGLTKLERDHILDRGRSLLHRRFELDYDAPFEPSVPAGDMDPGIVMPALGIGDHVHDVDPKGQYETAKRRRTPKRRP